VYYIGVERQIQEPIEIKLQLVGEGSVAPKRLYCYPVGAELDTKEVFA
jgi:hypothetical protein